MKAKKNEKKKKKNETRVTPLPQIPNEIYMTPYPKGFLLSPPQYITLKVSDYPQNITGPHLVINDSSLNSEFDDHW